VNISSNATDRFESRHIGPDSKETKEMLNTIGVKSVDELIDQTVPKEIRINKTLNLPAALSEYEYLRMLKAKSQKNQVFKTYIGLGYYSTHTPSVILRNIFENPGWYTQYTPYQAEIAQGRLEALLNYQTMVSDLTGLPVANASLLDEGTAAAEAMNMFYHTVNKTEAKADTFFVDQDCLPQTIDILKTRALPVNIKIEIGDYKTFTFSEKVFGALIQYPAKDGAVNDYREFISNAHKAGAYVAMATDLLALTLLTPPAELDADVAVGNAQRFGVPMGFGGPHAAFFATKDDFKRIIPGRIIGVSIDSQNNRALRMALQTREQHIRREKATSNICTAQALLAIMSGMYAVYHGPKGLKDIATRIHLLAVLLEKGLVEMGFAQLNENYFDTLNINVEDLNIDNLRSIAETNQVNFHYDGNHVSISLDETTMPEDVVAILNIFSEAKNQPYTVTIPAVLDSSNHKLPAALTRKGDYLTHPVFNQYHSESKMMRYIKFLENKDLSLTHSMISLGSCTMKLNAATELMPVSWPEFGQIHPFVPQGQVRGYMEMIHELETYLSEITGFAATSLQPNSGAQGEYAGLLVIHAFHADNGQGHRNIALIPSSAHGTNPASAVMAGMQVVVVKCDTNGNIDVADLKAKAEQHKDHLSCLMVTYPSTHGVFEATIKDICNIIHENGGQVYMDGANMNAQVGLTNPGTIGADVCHLNLHKTFAIPHGGGGPGMGPICVAAHLAPYLPGHKLVGLGNEKSIHAVSAAPWGSASILLISYAYIRMLGPDGVTNATKVAILNANYIKARLEKAYKVLYVGANNRVAHELIIDFRDIKAAVGIEVEDAAKRLMDYGFHAPTMSFPVPGTMMIEPTESEDKAELDNFCEALLQIKEEINEVQSGIYELTDNALKNAPHTQHMVLAEQWNHKYPREKAAFPLHYVRLNKFWPSVGRVNNSYGDRNLICTCPPIEEYEESSVAVG
jgi:glycine dehydrogenase